LAQHYLTANAFANHNMVKTKSYKNLPWYTKGTNEQVTSVLVHPALNLKQDTTAYRTV